MIEKNVVYVHNAVNVPMQRECWAIATLRHYTGGYGEDCTAWEIALYLKDEDFYEEIKKRETPRGYSHDEYIPLRVTRPKLETSISVNLKVTK